MRLIMEFSNRLCYLQINMIETGKMLQNIFVQFFAMYSFTQKRLCHWNARKCSIKEDFSQIGSLSISLNIKQYKKIAGINHQYMDIYHTKRQTENIPR